MMKVEVEEIYYSHDKRLEPWMLFSMKLGRFLNKYSRANKSTFNIYLSLPNALTFSYFLSHGIFDAHMEQTINRPMIAKRFQQLEDGCIVYYLDGDKWKRCSVQGVLKDYTESSPWHLVIANNAGVKDYVPYYKWETHIIITNRKLNRILNARVVNNIEKISGPLTEIYSSRKINQREMLNIPSLYIIGNRTEFDKHSNCFCLKYKDVKFYHEDILKDGSTQTFRNIQWVKKDDEDTYPVTGSDWLLMIGAAKAVARMDEFKSVGKIMLNDQFENADTSEMLRDAIEQDIILNKKSIITAEIIKQLQDEQIEIPKGVSFLAWK